MFCVGPRQETLEGPHPSGREEEVQEQLAEHARPEQHDVRPGAGDQGAGPGHRQLSRRERQGDQAQQAAREGDVGAGEERRHVAQGSRHQRASKSNR